MSASVNPPPPPPLPERSSASDVEEALDFATAGHPDGPLRILAAEVLHLRKACEEKGSELGSLTFQVGEVIRAWMRVDRDELGAEYPKLAGELDELDELTGYGS